MNTTNILKVNNLYKIYHTINSESLVLNNISFDVNKCDFISIVGPSGCGKSTILNILSGIDKEYKGNIEKKDNIKIGYMFQNSALFDWLTVLDNCLILLKISNNLNDETKNYVINLLKKYNLYEYKDKYPNNLSGGMKQRVALIRALSTNPDILLLDEAFSALDYQTRLKVTSDVYNIIKAENKTAIMVTHDLSEAISLSNKIIVLSKLPATIKNIYNINLPNKDIIKNKNTKEFMDYYELLWKDIDTYE